MYTTKEFEQTAIQKGYEFDCIRYSRNMMVASVSGFVFTNKGKLRVFWTNDGRAFIRDNHCPEFDLFKKDEKGENALD